MYPYDPRHYRFERRQPAALRAVPWASSERAGNFGRWVLLPSVVVWAALIALALGLWG